MLRRHFPLGLVGFMQAGHALGGLPELIDSTAQSVVAVGTFDPLKNPRFAFRGTGFVVGSGRRVVTNSHVLPDADSTGTTDRLAILVPARPGQAADLRLANLIANDPAHDLSLLSFAGDPLPELKLSGDKSSRAGTAVALIGYPLGTALGVVPVTHRGIISAIAAIALPAAAARQLDARTLNRLRQGAFDIYQLDATAYPGNSGSPLLDLDTGLVVGVVNMVFVRSTKESAIDRPSGITYAIPSRYVSELMLDATSSAP